MSNSSQEFSVDLLSVYYARLFPYDAMFNWLSYGKSSTAVSTMRDPDRDYFGRREWSFTIEDDIYIRYQSFLDKKEFCEAIQKRQPHKIDIGAVFSLPPKEHKTAPADKFKTVERELVFDIDMTDYDNIRRCCTGANICLKCWPYMTMAIKTVHRALTEDFGFNHILWIYSGRRGVHCWVCDPIARQLSNEARSAVVEYLSVEVGSSENSDEKLKRTFRRPLHPHVQRSYDLLEEYFERYIVSDDGQAIFNTEEASNPVCSCPDKEIREQLLNEWKRNPKLTGVQKWRQIKSIVGQGEPNSKSKKTKLVDYDQLHAWMVELVLKHTYPRLDANVSKAQNHLLKSPFCVHPKTGRVCIPIDPDRADEFNPFSVPTIRELAEEINEYDASHSGSDLSDSDKTRMREAMETFNRCFMSGLKEHIKRIRREKADEEAAMAVDF